MRETLDRMAAGVPHQGIIAVVSEKPVLSLEELLETAHQPALVVVLDGVEDPRNLGAILRTAEAAGADGVLLPERHSAGLSETVAARPRARSSTSRWRGWATSCRRSRR